MVLWLKLLPVYLLIITLVVLTFFADFIFKQSSASQVETKKIIKNEQVESQYMEGMPIALSIPQLNINTKVEIGDYIKQNKTWKIADTSAFFASMSAKPNNLSRDTMIYGHNSNKIFGKTKNLQYQDRLYLYTDKNLVFEYLFEGSKEVKPDDVKSLEYQGPARLTLITCTGLFNETRRLMRFKFVSVSALQQSRTK